jgi:hypothetical protein
MWHGEPSEAASPLVSLGIIPNAMPSERVRRRIDAFLDEAEEAAARQYWHAVAGATRAVLGMA